MGAIYNMVQEIWVARECDFGLYNQLHTWEVDQRFVYKAEHWQVCWCQIRIGNRAKPARPRGADLS